MRLIYNIFLFLCGISLTCYSQDNKSVEVPRVKVDNIYKYRNKGIKVWDTIYVNKAFVFSDGSILNSAAVSGYADTINYLYASKTYVNSQGFITSLTGALVIADTTTTKVLTRSIADNLYIKPSDTTSTKVITRTIADGLYQLTGSYLTSLSGALLISDTISSKVLTRKLSDTYYIKVSDTIASKVLTRKILGTLGYMKLTDTVSLSTRINTKLTKSDTASLSNRINTKLSIVDTASLVATRAWVTSQGYLSSISGVLTPSDTVSIIATKYYVDSVSTGTVLVDDILDFSTNKYTPYSTKTTSCIYTGTTNPTGTVRLNFDRNVHVTNSYTNTSNATRFIVTPSSSNSMYMDITGVNLTTSTLTGKYGTSGLAIGGSSGSVYFDMSRSSDLCYISASSVISSGNTFAKFRNNGTNIFTVYGNGNLNIPLGANFMINGVPIACDSIAAWVLDSLNTRWDSNRVTKAILDTILAHPTEVDSSIYATKYWVDNVSNVGQWYNMYGTNTSNWDNAATWVSNNGGNATNWDNTYNDVSSNSSHWISAYSWGNHADAGYLTSESDPDYAASTASQLVNASTVLEWNDGTTTQYVVLSAFGGMYVQSPPAYNSTTTYRTFTGLSSDGHLRFCTVADSIITISVGGSGYYNITYYLSASVTSMPATAYFKIYVNDIAVDISYQEQYYPKDHIYESISGGCHVNLEEGDKIKLKYQTNGANSIPTHHVLVLINRIGQ